MTPLISPDDHATLWAIIASGTAAAIWLEQNYRWAARLSGPVIALLLAMILSNARVVPTDAPVYDFVEGWLVPLAIPLLLLRANVRERARDRTRRAWVAHRVLSGHPGHAAGHRARRVAAARRHRDARHRARGGTDGGQLHRRRREFLPGEGEPRHLPGRGQSAAGRG